MEINDGHSPYTQEKVKKQVSQRAIWSLIAGLAIGFTSGVSIIWAFYNGYKALDDIEKSNGTITGKGMAIAGIALGWISIAFVIIGLIVVFS